MATILIGCRSDIRCMVRVSGRSKRANSDGMTQAGEIVPVPEPSSVATVLGLLGLVGWRERRKGQAARRMERCQ